MLETFFLDNFYASLKDSSGVESCVKAVNLISGMSFAANWFDKPSRVEPLMFQPTSAGNVSLKRCSMNFHRFSAKRSGKLETAQISSGDRSDDSSQLVSDFGVLIQKVIDYSFMLMNLSKQFKQTHLRHFVKVSSPNFVKNIGGFATLIRRMTD